MRKSSDLLSRVPGGGEGSLSQLSAHSILIHTRAGTVSTSVKEMEVTAGPCQPNLVAWGLAQDRNHPISTTSPNTWAESGDVKRRAEMHVL